MTLQAIQTHYAGHFFRSRGEARYAVFLDSLGVKWEYEAEGYCLPGVGNYLPDFRLPDLNSWIEIKASSPSANEKRKARALAEESGESVYIFFGGMGDPVFIQDPIRIVDGARAIGFGTVPISVWNEDRDYDVTAAWAECTSCGSVNIVTAGDGNRINRYVCQCPKKNVNPLGAYLKASYAAARTARFEHDAYGRRAQRLRPMLRSAPSTPPTPSRQESTDDTQAVWAGLLSEIFTSPIDRAVFHTAKIVGLDGSTFVISMTPGSLMLLKDSKKREIRDALRARFGRDSDARFISHRAPHGSR